MDWKRSVAAGMVAVALATAALPTRAYARGHVYYRVGRDVSDDVGEDIAIGAGITTGVLALVGGLVWYYIHRRHAGEPVTAPAPTDSGATSN